MYFFSPVRMVAIAISSQGICEHMATSKIELNPRIEISCETFHIQWCGIKDEQHKFKLNSSHKSLKTTLYNFLFYYFKGINYKLFINKINYFLLWPFFSFLASLLDEVKIDLWDKIRTKLSDSTFICHKSVNPQKPWLIITQLSIRSRYPFIFDDFDASGLHGCYQRAASGKWNIIPSIFCCLP